MKNLISYNIFNEANNNQLDFGDLLIDSFKKYFEREIGNITIGSWGRNTIFSDKEGELFRLYKYLYSNKQTNFFTCTIKDNLYFNHKHITKTLKEKLDYNVTNNIHNRNFIKLISFLDTENFEKVNKIKKIVKFNL